MNLSIIEHQNKRVLTTAQLAESYGTDNKSISNNFNNNRNRYEENKHFLALTGNELREFKSKSEILGIAQNANILYLWTEKGAWLHAKSLNTDEAWDAYEMLVDDYYKIKEHELELSMLSPELRALINIEKKQIESDKRMNKLEGEVSNISNIVTITNVDWRKKVDVIIKKIARKWTGVEPYRSVRNYSYERLEERAGCNLNIRLNNRKERALAQGMTKTFIKNINKLDVIAEEKRFVEIYLQVIKEMAIQFRVDVNDFEEVI